MKDHPSCESAARPAPSPFVVLACSGCSTAGELADLTARRLQEHGVARMSCLAGVGGRIPSILATVSQARGILMIDGCPLECGANVLRLAGLKRFQHLKLHEQEIRKHGQPVDAGTVERLAAAAAKELEVAGGPSPARSRMPLA